MKYMKDTAETARLIAERDAKFAEIRSRHSPEAIEKRDCGYYGTHTTSADPVTIEAALLNRELEEINKQYASKIDESREVATADEAEEAEVKALWGEFYDKMNAFSEKNPELFR